MGTLPSKYLHMPLSENSLKTSGWKALIIIIKKRMLNRSFHALNTPSRIIMLRSILQAIHIYHLSGMAALKKICVDMVSLFKKFL